MWKSEPICGKNSDGYTKRKETCSTNETIGDLRTESLFNRTVFLICFPQPPYSKLFFGRIKLCFLLTFQADPHILSHHSTKGPNSTDDICPRT